jgi:two-component system, NarL family, sensor histidine kinase DesK
VDNMVTTTATQPAGSVRSTFLLWLVWILWLPLFVPSIVALAQSHPSALQMAISILGAVAFFACYLWISWQSARALAAHAPRIYPEGLALWAPITALVGLGIGLTLWDGYSWGTLFFYIASGVAGWLPPKRAAVVVAGLVLFIALGLGLKGDFADAITPIVFVGIVGAIVIAFNWSLTNSQQLRLAREEMGRAAAINEERLRIARDLHDLLGHNLSLIALKSELAQRLVDSAPDRAANEMHDVEQVARQALREVREAVASYRQPTLASELRGAREMLAAAGIAYDYQGDAGIISGLSAAVESVLAWTVREGVTNVIRHSGARRCTIGVARDEQGIRVAVVDDGKATSTHDSDNGATGGNGLRGLAERVAALGGRFAAGMAEGGGFRLEVVVPLARGARDEQSDMRTSADADTQKTIAASQP